MPKHLIKSECNSMILLFIIPFGIIFGKQNITFDFIEPEI